MSARPLNRAIGKRQRRDVRPRADGVSERRVALGTAHVGLARVGAVSLLVVVLRYSHALWAQWVDFDFSTATLGRAVSDAATFFGGVPRRWVFEEPDCRVVHWDGLREHFADLLQAIARHLGSELVLWHERWCGPATRSSERLIWETACPAPGALAAGNAALRVVLAQAMRRPHPHEPARSIAEALAVERVHLSPLPASWTALAPWFEAEGSDG